MKKALSNGEQRAAYGCTVSFVSEDGHRLTLSRTGPPAAALNDLCDEALAVDPTYRVIAYSTPESILKDIQHRRPNSYDGRRRNGGDTMPEVTALARIGRRDLCHHTLIGREAQ